MTLDDLLGDERWTEIGTLQLRTGRVVHCDPFSGMHAPPFTERVAPGSHPVRVLPRRGASTNEELAFVQVRFASGPIARWTLALTPGERLPLRAHETVGLRVLSACYALVDDADQRRLFIAAKHGQLRKMMENPREAAVALALDAPSLSAVVVRTGADGLVPAYLGLDGQGEVLLLMVPAGFAGRFAAPSHLSDDELDARSYAVMVELNAPVAVVRRMGMEEAGALGHRAAPLIERLGELCLGSDGDLAAEAMASLAHDLPSLRARLDEPWERRGGRMAAIALMIARKADNELWEATFVERVYGILRDGSDGDLVRRAAEAALSHSSFARLDAIAEDMVPRIQHSDPGVRWAAAAILKHVIDFHGSDAYIELLSTLQDDRDATVRQIVARMLGMQAFKQGFRIELVASLLDDTEPAVVLAAAQGLCSTRNTAVESRQPVIAALRRIADADGVAETHRARARRLLSWLYGPERIF